MTTVASAAIVQSKYPSTDCTGDPAVVTYEVSAINFNAHNPKLTTYTTLAKNAKKILYSLLNSSTHSFLLFCPSPPTFTPQYDTCQCVADYDESKKAKKNVCDSNNIYTKVTCEGAKIKFSLFTDKACAVAATKNTPPVGENPLLYKGSDGACHVDPDNAKQSYKYKGCPKEDTKKSSGSSASVTLVSAVALVVASIFV